jgi:hypothetical protein
VADQRFLVSDFDRGLQYALAKGWLTQDSENLTLTEAGFGQQAQADDERTKREEALARRLAEGRAE